ncbi:MAG TPA: hypothetical protein VH143_26110 [Kofleriaceae bacterium]|jgi:hypothetical protein|nr:hypothetical protein [Kofleriaceae bacterium]
MSADWEYREVCPDGACIGVIGDDGLCKVCGRAAPNWGNERKRGLVDDQTDAEPDEALEPERSAVPSNAVPSSAAAPEPPTGDAWDQRALCDNGACVGVIGDDGTCSVCGTRPAGGMR